MFRVLLAEDDSAMRFIYSRMKIWTECGFQIAEEVSNGKDALRILEDQTFDLVFPSRVYFLRRRVKLSRV